VSPIQFQRERGKMRERGIERGGSRGRRRERRRKRWERNIGEAKWSLADFSCTFILGHEF
jgi:hypothetical protein